jgi:hypothetical protein
MMMSAELFASLRKMISIGVEVTNSIIQAYEKEYPGNAIIEVLRNIQVGYIKEPQAYTY